MLLGTTKLHESRGCFGADGRGQRCARPWEITGPTLTTPDDLASWLVPPRSARVVPKAVRPLRVAHAGIPALWEDAQLAARLLASKLSTACTACRAFERIPLPLTNAFVTIRSHKRVPNLSVTFKASESSSVKEMR